MKRLLGLTLCLATLATGGAAAQSNYPDKPIRLITGSGAGGVVADVLAPKLSEALGKPVVVERVSGGNAAAEQVARSAPDGYTILLSGDSAMTTNVTLYEKLPFDPLKDFAPISLVVDAVNILVVHPSVPAKNVPDLVALAKAQPGKLSFASTGNGTSQHLGGELFKSMAGIDILHVPYKGVGPLLPDLLSGRVAMQFGNISSVLPLVREGKLRGLAVSSLKRAPLAPELPTMAESGFPGFAVAPWLGMLAPAGTPEPIIRRLHQETLHVVSLPEVRARFGDLGMIIVGSRPEEFAERIKAEIVSKGKIVRATGAKAK